MPELVNSAAQLESVFITLWPWLWPSEVLGLLKPAAERVVELPTHQSGHVTGSYLFKESRFTCLGAVVAGPAADSSGASSACLVASRKIGKHTSAFV